MCSSYTEAFVALSQCAKNLGTLLNLETVLTEELKFLMLCGYGWCVDYQA